MNSIKMHVMFTIADFIIWSENWEKPMQRLQSGQNYCTVLRCNHRKSTATLAECHTEQIGCSGYVKSIPGRTVILDSFMHT